MVSMRCILWCAICLLGIMFSAAGACNLAPPKSLAQDADRLWPTSEVAMGYERALKLFRSGEAKSATLLVRDLVSKPLRLGPDSVLDEDWETFELFYSDRLLHTVYNMRTVFYENRRYALEQQKSGNTCMALECFRTNVLLSQQIMHIQPYDAYGLIVGIKIWQTTFGDIRRIYASSGDKPNEQLAALSIQKAKWFEQIYIKPMLSAALESSQLLLKKVGRLPEKQRREQEDRPLRVHQRKYSRDTHSLITLWDSQIKQ